MVILIANQQVSQRDSQITNQLANEPSGWYKGRLSANQPVFNQSVSQALLFGLVKSTCYNY